MTALVLGAGGFLGINLVDALLAGGGDPPRCGRRRRSNVLALRQRRVPLVPADLDQPDELAAAMTGCDVVYHVAGHYPRLSLDREGAIATGVGQLDRIFDAAATAGVRRIVYVSSTATVAPSPSGISDETNRFESPPGYGTYHNLKWAMEQRALEEDRLEVVVACPGACLGPWDLRVGTSALLVAMARGLDPPYCDGVVNLVDARDVALALCRLGGHAAPPRRVILAGGSERLGLVLARLGHRYHRGPPPPALTAAAATRFADEEEERVAVAGGRPLLSREIVDLVAHGVPVNTALAEQTLDMHWRSLDATLDAFDEWARRMRMIPPLPSPEKEE